MIFVRVANLAGIKDPITSINKTDIFDMIKTTYANLSLEEINRAFTMERYGKFEDTTEHYQLFNAEYVSKILKKYIKWLSYQRERHGISAFQIEENMEPSNEEKEAMTRNGLIDNFEYFKKNGSVGIGRTWSYELLYAKKLLPKHTEEMRESIKSDALDRIKQQKETAVKPRDKKRIIAALKEIAEGKNQMKTECQKIILERFYGSLMIDKKELKDLI